MPPIELSDVSRRHLLGAAGASLASIVPPACW